MSKTPPQDSAARRCAYHCGNCGSHFLSLQAFDDHRGGTYEPPTRCCWPEDLEDHKLEIAREDGICEIGGGPPKIAVCLWRRDPTWRADTAESRVSPAITAFDAPDGDLAA